MKQIPTAEEFLELWKDSKYPVSYQMKQFAKLHVEAALEASASEYYPKDKENFELITERFLNAYPLDNIK